jgi:hypothetical protein
MQECPRCHAEYVTDPETGWVFCLLCGEPVAPPKAPPCPGPEPWQGKATRLPYRPREH